MIIDGHAHACGSYQNIKSIEQNLSKQKIDYIILCGGEPNSKKDYYYPMLSKVFRGEKLGYFFNKIICKIVQINNLSKYIDEQNEYVYNIAKALPNKVGNAYWINPLDEDCMDKMEEFYYKNGFKIIKMHQCWTGFQIDSNNCLKIFKWAAERKLPVFIHLLSEKEVEKFVLIANRFKDTTFIVAHMIGLDYMAERLNNRNVFFDLSAPQLYSIDILRKAVSKIGIDRLLLGSDTPFGKNNVEKVMLRLNRIHLSKEEIEMITSKNMKKLLYLE